MVGPAAVRDGLTALRVAYGPVAEEDHKLGFDRFSGGGTGNLGGFRLLSLADDVMYPVIGGDASPLFDRVKAGEWIELYPVFSALPETINRVEVLLPHSDDVLDDASNQPLSEQRAKAVADRLGQLTSLNAWQQTVAGKGGVTAARAE